MEFILSWMIVIGVGYCLYHGLPFSWMRRNGYVKYRILYTNEFDSFPEGLYIIQDSCFGILWKKARFDDHDLFFKLWNNNISVESDKLEDVQKAKQLAEETAATKKQRYKQKKITKIIE